MAERNRQTRRTPVFPGARDEAAESRVLEMVAEMATRQRAAILARDVRALDRLFEAFLQLHTELGALTAEREAGRDAATSRSVSALATRVREQLWLNRVLLENGMAMTDHYMACLGASSLRDGPVSTGNREPETRHAAAAALFSGVA